jgi:hypothetical protein
MNSIKKINWVRFVSILGIAFAIIALIGVGIIIMIWSDFYHISINIKDSIITRIGPFMLVAWIGELTCGIIILKRRKTLGRILILIGVLIFFFGGLLSAES